MHYLLYSGLKSATLACLSDPKVRISWLNLRNEYRALTIVLQILSGSRSSIRTFSIPCAASPCARSVSMHEVPLPATWSALPNQILVNVEKYEKKPPLEYLVVLQYMIHQLLVLHLWSFFNSCIRRTA